MPKTTVYDQRHDHHHVVETTGATGDTNDWIAKLAGKVTVTPTGCWVHGPDPDEYAVANVGGRSIRLHRLVYLNFVGDLPDDYHVHHECQTKACINPAHLLALTPAEHSQRHAEERRRRRAA